MQCVHDQCAWPVCTSWKLFGNWVHFPNVNSRYTNLQTVCSCTCTNQFPMCILELFLLCIAWQATTIISYNVDIFDKIADLSATKNIFNYFKIWLLVYKSKCDCFNHLEFVFRWEQYGTLDKYFIQGLEFKCDISFGCPNSSSNSPIHCHRWIWVTVYWSRKMRISREKRNEDYQGYA